LGVEAEERVKELAQSVKDEYPSRLAVVAVPAKEEVVLTERSQVVCPLVLHRGCGPEGTLLTPILSSSEFIQARST
jgi:hypothetical protein